MTTAVGSITLNMQLWLPVLREVKRIAQEMKPECLVP